MNIGLFFGSFNPLHTGHLIIANTVKELTELNQVWFVVSPQNPLKSSRNLLPEYDRLRMVEHAIEDNFDLRASNIEFSMPRPSYTIDTMAYLSDRYPQHQFTLLIGEDNLKSFYKWKNSKELLEQYGLIVYPRPGISWENVGEKALDIKNHQNVKVVEAPLIEISATFIRNCVKNNISIKYLVHERVEQYIMDKKLFN